MLCAQTAVLSRRDRETCGAECKIGSGRCGNNCRQASMNVTYICTGHGVSMLVEWSEWAACTVRVRVVSLSECHNAVSPDGNGGLKWTVMS